MFKIAVAALSAVGLMSCTAHDASAQRPSAASSSETPRLSPGQGRLSAYTSINLRMFETLGACEHLNRDGAGDQAFAAHLRRHAPTADQAERRALREAYRLLYRSNLNVKQACEKIATDHTGPEPIALLLEFIESSQRGIIR